MLEKNPDCLSKVIEKPVSKWKLILCRWYRFRNIIAITFSEKMIKELIYTVYQEMVATYLFD